MAAMASMSRAISRVFLSLAPVALAAPLLAADPPVIQHEPLTCIPERTQAKVSANLKSSSPIVSARLYFRSDAFEGDYYFEMRQGEGDYFYAALPFPELSKTKQAHYRIAVKNREGGEASTKSFIVPVDKKCYVSMTPDEVGYAENLILGKTRSDQTTIPEGWKCQHLISYITPDGVLIPALDCKVMAPLLKAALIGGAVAVPGAIIISNTGGGDDEPVSRARPQGSSGN